MIEPNVRTESSASVSHPQVDGTAYVHPLASVIGNVRLGRDVFVAPGASVRGDEGQPLFVGDDSNVQDGVVLHALATEMDGQALAGNRVVVDGRFYAVYVGARVSLAHQAQIHGPAVVMHDTFVGMKALVFRARVGAGCVIEPGAIVMGVEVPPGRYVEAGVVLRRQEDADRLPVVDDSYSLRDVNRDIVRVNTALARAYLAAR